MCDKKLLWHCLGGQVSSFVKDFTKFRTFEFCFESLLVCTLFFKLFSSFSLDPSLGSFRPRRAKVSTLKWHCLQVVFWESLSEEDCLAWVCLKLYLL